MFSEKDLSQIDARGANLETILEQIENFKNGFPYLNVIKAATIDDGMIQLGDEKATKLAKDFDDQIFGKKLLKFVPASGAASRMFKSLFAALEEDKIDKSVNEFLERLQDFAFYNSLIKSIGSESADHKTILKHLLTAEGLDYGSLPKGLLEFHKYGDSTRTPAEEHLVEGAKYANAGGKVNLHFTVSPEHRSKFQALIDSVLASYEAKFGVKYSISFSEQKPSTDTIAVNLDNTPFRNANGDLLFRPAGHGALLENLNDQDADVVFIKNIDNVVPDSLKEQTIIYKKALASLVLSYQEAIFAFLKMMDGVKISEVDLLEISEFLENELCVEAPEDYEDYTLEEKITYCRAKLNRPLRICGMVKNVGEPGGGPFWAENADGSTSLQVVESAQIDLKDPDQKEIFDEATHFNPVDLICTLKDYKGNKFNLLDFRDPKTGFNTQKSQSGRDLKAQELPGLWNGAMADWNTLFVEVPLITFNPVKTVNDLLRPEHQ
ncbi:hypothetical protein EMA8858_03211 [Emticicia aquatica]|jgi:hypothetical protein|uniref:DUF4301 domain-containing protein n=1 Tax=Emticicia aquatica TaxID=1681835 RepID=A0ABM9AT22_9BACT|nr:DUF4301 family protein [Emticicia aquatica]CAH0997074.1 hypothetical protein EMA8858_03211 [Emticicia aquatica]